MEPLHPPRVERLDGNAAGGMLSELFAEDVTAAEATCGGCGRSAMLGDAIAELDERGVILLCRGCEHTLLTYVRTDSGSSLDIGGLRTLRWSPPR